MFDLDAEGFVVGFEEAGLEFLKHFRQAGIEAKTSTEFAEARIGGAVDAEAIEEQLHVGEFVIEAEVLDEFVRLFPKRPRVDSEGGENDLFLHVIWAEGQVVVVNDGDGVLRCGHGAVLRDFALDPQRGQGEGSLGGRGWGLRGTPLGGLRGSGVDVLREPVLK